MYIRYVTQITNTDPSKFADFRDVFPRIGTQVQGDLCHPIKSNNNMCSFSLLLVICIEKISQ